jgi:hypothetical protein
MRSALVLILFVALLADFAPRSLAARLKESMSYEEMLKASDLIVIATATESKDNSETAKFGGWKVDFVGVDTTFEVKGTIKGKAPDKKITVLHFRLPDETAIINGPCLVSFRSKRVQFQYGGGVFGCPAPDYLLFLKASKNPKEARYEPVSGRVDPDCSAREMYAPGIGDLLDAKK